MDKSIDERTPLVYVFYARGHMSHLCPIKLEFKPRVECRAQVQALHGVCANYMIICAWWIHARRPGN